MPIDLTSIDYKGIIAEYVIHNAFDLVIRSAKKIINKSNSEIRKDEEAYKKQIKKSDAEIDFGSYELLTNAEELESHFEFSLKNAFNWSSEVSFRDLHESKSILQTFIELDFYLTPRKIHFSEFNESKKIKILDAICSSNKNVIILGAPGAGKTTVGKYLCLSLLLKDEKLSHNYGCPIVIRLRDYNQLAENEVQKLDLQEILLRSLDVRIKIPEEVKYGNTNETVTKLKILSKVIDTLRLLIIIDGFDEVIDESLRRRIIADLDKLCNSLTEGRIILTSRAADFDYTISNSWTYEICPLTDGQIKQFTKKWLTNSHKAKALQKQIFTSPFKDTAMRPLTLAHLCAIFERYNKIPEKPKSVYKKIITLLIEEWDAQHGIERKSKYSNFEVDRKTDFLARMAFELTARYKAFTFSKRELAKCYQFNSSRVQTSRKGDRRSGQ